MQTLMPFIFALYVPVLGLFCNFRGVGPSPVRHCPCISDQRCSCPCAPVHHWPCTTLVRLRVRPIAPCYPPPPAPALGAPSRRFNLADHMRAFRLLLPRLLLSRLLLSLLLLLSILLLLPLLPLPRLLRLLLLPVAAAAAAAAWGCCCAPPDAVRAAAAADAQRWRETSGLSSACRAHSSPPCSSH